MDTQRIDKDTVFSSLNFQNYFKQELPSLKTNGSGQAQALCCFHEDHHPSFSINLENGLCKCFGCGFEGDVFTFHQRKYDLSFQDAVDDLGKFAGIEEPQKKKKIAASYDYSDQNGNLLFQVVRYERKGFTQRRPDGKGGWIYNLEGVTTVLYNLPEVVRAETVFIVEGEKDVGTLKAIGVVSTTNPMGAGKWKDHYDLYLAGKHLVILPDNDEPGRKHVEEVAASLNGTAKSVKVVRLPELAEHGDVTDWLTAGHDKSELLALVSATSEWTGPSEEKGVLSRLTRFKDLKNEEISTEWIVEGIIPEGSVETITAKGGIGKTYLAMGAIKAIETGTDFLGLKTKRVPCYYLDYENPRPVMKERAIELNLNESFFWHIGDKQPPPRLDSKEYIELIKLPPGAIFVDSLRASQSGDENSSRDMAEIMRRAKELRDYGHTVIFLHHTTKANERQFRGSLAIFDQADHVLNFYPVRDAESGKAIEIDDTDDLDSLTFYLGTKEKTRYKPFHIYIKRAGNGTFVIADDPRTARMRAIQELLKDKGPMNQTDLLKAIKTELGYKNDGKIRKLLKDGNDKFWATRKGENNSINYGLYGFTTYSSSKNRQTESDNFAAINAGASEIQAQGFDNTGFNGYNKGKNQTDKPNDDDFIPEISEDL
jgi:hypothetical protein